jgi:hypothetical protein
MIDRFILQSFNLSSFPQLQINSKAPNHPPIGSLPFQITLNISIFASKSFPRTAICMLMSSLLFNLRNFVIEKFLITPVANDLNKFVISEKSAYDEIGILIRMLFAKIMEIRLKVP